MKLCYLGGEERRRYLQEAASPGVTVGRLEDVTSSAGRPDTIESLYDEALLAPWTVEMAVEAERRGFDAVITGCVGDPGVEAAREMVGIPVIGPGQAAFHAAAMLGINSRALPVAGLRPCERSYGTVGWPATAWSPVNCTVMARAPAARTLLDVARRCR
jgi:hypothetical protein